MSPRLLPYGPSGWLVELAAGDVIGYDAAVRRAADPGVAEVVPAARTVLVTLAVPEDRERIGNWLAALAPDLRDATGSDAAIDIPVVYDGDDLDAVAATAGMAVDEVVERHAGGRYRCAFCGFAPGFAYLIGLDRALQLPRRPTPRTRVPAGAVAIAAEYTAVYPSASPGGWHLIGSSDAPLWDIARAAPALIRPGTIVRFVPQR